MRECMLFILSVIKLRTINIYIAISLLLVPSYLNALVIGTYNVPPFSMYEDGEQIGMATEAINDLLSQAGITSSKIINYPLARGIVELKNGRVDIFYPYIVTTNDKKLENLTLIGPISTYNIALFVRSDFNATISLETMQHQTVAAERGGIATQLLKNYTFNIEHTTDKTSCLTMVVAKRVPCCVIGKLPGMYLATLNNMSDRLHFVQTSLYADVYLVLGPSVPREVVVAIQNTYEKLKHHNYFIIKQKDYEKKFAVFIESLQ